MIHQFIRYLVPIFYYSSKYFTFENQLLISTNSSKYIIKEEENKSNLTDWGTSWHYIWNYKIQMSVLLFLSKGESICFTCFIKSYELFRNWLYRQIKDPTWTLRIKIQIKRGYLPIELSDYFSWYLGQFIRSKCLCH